MARERPTESEIFGWFDTLSNWGRWGKDDLLGTLNLITPEKRRAAAALVREGIHISCAWPISYEPTPEVPAAPRHFMLASGDEEPPADSIGRTASADAFVLNGHGLTLTHLDTPSHTFWRPAPGKPRTMFNGFSPSLVRTRDGATAGSIELVGNGIVTRGVLLDIARLQGVDYLEPGTEIFPEDLEAAEAAQGARVESGDALFIRTGHPKYRTQVGPAVRPGVQAGPQAACLPWFRARDIALLGCDVANDVRPIEFPRTGGPVHGIGMSALGLWLMDSGNHEELAEACARLGRWEFMLVIAPLKLHNGTASPVNPIAIL